eukprot:TRINITY_DN2424_c0_g1_i2.p2 TRINITY_DN2424_c0_g1~~TRINITY_DN2424_c0_g1_i2.p2  ORF type:complete len:178 (-),score=19.45 TRINITY_DN2424_c0_g1_i2:98-631(-)
MSTTVQLDFVRTDYEDESTCTRVIKTTFSDEPPAIIRGVISDTEWSEIVAYVRGFLQGCDDAANDFTRFSGRLLIPAILTCGLAFCIGGICCANARKARASATGKRLVEETIAMFEECSRRFADRGITFVFKPSKSMREFGEYYPSYVAGCHIEVSVNNKALQAPLGSAPVSAYVHQ